MRRLFVLLILGVLVFGSFRFSVSGIAAATSVNGLISVDTTWSKNSSPYILSGPIGIQANVTLTIEPGVEVNFNKYFIQVNGTLHACGIEDHEIYFYTSSFSDFFVNQRIEFCNTSANSDANCTGCLVDHAIFNSVTVSVQGGSPKISNSEFKNLSNTGINVDAGSPQIINNTFHSPTASHMPSAIVAGGNALVFNNEINGFSYGMYARGNVYVVNNRILNCAVGVNSNENATLEGNVIANCTNRGISGHGEAVRIRYNYIVDNSVGIFGKGIITSNTITENGLGIENPGWPFIDNNIVNNSINNVLAENPYNITARNNWWGTTEVEVINQTIHDFKNDFRRGEIRFVPCLTEPSTTAPVTPEAALLLHPSMSTYSKLIQDGAQTPSSPNSSGIDSFGQLANQAVNNDGDSLLFTVAKMAILVSLAAMALGIFIKHRGFWRKRSGK